MRKIISLADATYASSFTTRDYERGARDGRLPTYYTRRRYPELYTAFVEIKKLFDPENI